MHLIVGPGVVYLTRRVCRLLLSEQIVGDYILHLLKVWVLKYICPAAMLVKNVIIA